MTLRRNFLATTALVASTAPLRSAFAQAPKEGAKNADYLFVQNASSMSFDKAKSTLTLKGVSPHTIFFSDRPERIAGNMPTPEFVPFWSEGTDSFQKSPPNANLSILSKDKSVSDVVVVLRDPVLKGANLSYTVQILEGNMPASGGAVSLFIDIIGMPMTPLSYAGVARRTAFRRAAFIR